MTTPVSTEKEAPPPMRKHDYVIIGATEPSGDTLDWLDDTVCISYPQAIRRRAFIAEELKPHDDGPRYYFIRTLRRPASDAGNGERQAGDPKPSV